MRVRTTSQADDRRKDETHPSLCQVELQVFEIFQGTLPKDPLMSVFFSGLWGPVIEKLLREKALRMSYHRPFSSIWSISYRNLSNNIPILCSLGLQIVSLDNPNSRVS